MKYLFLVLLTAVAGVFPAHAAEPDTLVVLDAARETPGEPPSGWENILPESQRSYTDFTVERSDGGAWLRIRSTAAGSLLERDLRAVDIRTLPVLEWEWNVDRFPSVEWEQDPDSDDFALRIELVYDYPGAWYNPLNILRKGFISSVFRGHPPVRIVSYVWAVNVPAGQAYVSPENRRITIVPVESGRGLAGNWLRERVVLSNDLEKAEPGNKLVLTRIRLRADTDDTGSTVESGLRYVRLVRE